VTDFAGRQVVYSYDDDGNLTSARSPVVSSTGGFNDFPNGRTTKYTYHTGTHLLSGVIRPNQVGGQPERPYVTFDYHQNTSGWWLNYVQKQTLGGDEIQYYYEPLVTVPSDNFTTQRMRTQVTDRRGHLTNYYFNHNGNVLLKEEYSAPGVHVDTAFEYNDDGEITSIVHPKGNKETRTYTTNGQRFQDGNLASIMYSRNTATDVDQTTDAITVHFAWEPVFNHLLWRDDPRDVAWKTQFVLDYMEGSDSPSDPNYVGDEVAAELGVDELAAQSLLSSLVQNADLNGDGVGGANGTVLVRGIVVQRIEPSVNLDQSIGADNQASAEGGSTPNSQEAIFSWTYNSFGQVTSQTDAEENVTLFLYTPWDDLDADGFHDVTGAATSEVTGGLPRQTIQDAALPHPLFPELGSVGRSLPTDVGRNVGHPSPPAPVNRTLDIFFNTYRFPVSFVDGRGVKHEVYLNELGEAWKTRRGVDAAAASTRQGGPVEEPNETHISGTAFAYGEKFQRDANGLIVHAYVQNSGETPDDNGYWETTYQYDILNNLRFEGIEKAGGQFVTTETQYDKNENVAKFITPSGNWTRYEYDYRDQLTKTYRGNSFVGEEQLSERVYDDNGNVSLYRDGNLNATTYVIDEFDRANKVIDAIGNERRNVYDLASNITKAEDWGKTSGVLTLVRSTLSSYDERSRPWRIDRKGEDGTIVFDGALEPDAEKKVSARIDYDRLSRITFRTEDDGKAYEAHYDGMSRRVWSKDPAGNIRTGAFDDEGNLVKHIETDVYPNAATRTFWTWRRYDGLGRLSSFTNQLGETDRYGYDSRDLLVSASDAEAPGTAGQIHTVNVNPPGNTRSYRYDGRGLLLSETMDLREGGTGTGAIDTSNPYNPDGNVVISQEWDDDGRLYKRFDDNQGSGGNGTFTQYVWDFRNRLEEEIFADLTKIVRTYDGNHNVTGITDARQNVSISVYDQLDRLTSVSLLSGPSASMGTVGLTFDYDGLGRRTLARSTYIDGTGTHQWDVTRSWDAFDRLRAETQNGKTLASIWTEEAKRTELIYPTSTPLGGILTVGYTFDSLDRVSRIKTNGTDLAAYSYAGPDRKLSRTLRNRTSTRWHDGQYNDTAYYDGATRITKLDHHNILDNPNTLLGSFEHEYNRVGSRLYERRIRVDQNGISVVFGDNYGHDSLYRLTKFERKVPAADIGTLGLGNDESDRTWTFDGVHNWRGFSIDTSNQVAAVDSVHQYMSFGSQQPSYDPDGNMTKPDTAGAVSMIYDFLNRLVEVDDGNGAMIEHVYDAEGRRVRSIFTGVVDAPLQRDYVYDGWEVIEEHELVTNPDPEGQPLQKFMRRYVMGITIDEPVCMEVLPGQDGARTLYYMQSTLGHVVGLTNNVGVVKERYTYDAYGQPRFENASNVPLVNQKSAYGNPYLFTGRRYEPWILPLYEYRNRFYLPEQGRFVQRDPIGHWTDLLAAGNGYAYCGSNGIDYNDPYGLEVLVYSRPVGGTLGLGSHSYIVVKQSTLNPATGKMVTQTTTLSGFNSDGILTGHVNDPRDTPRTNRYGGPDTYNGVVEIPPPPGMTQEEWEATVIAKGLEINNALNRAMGLNDNGEPASPTPAKPSKPKPGTFTPYKADPQNAPEKPGRNSNQYVSDVIQCSGGAIPENYDPPGYNPGLRTGPDAKRKPSVLERPERKD